MQLRLFYSKKPIIQGGLTIKTSNVEPRINGRIRARELKVVNEEGGFLGIVSTAEAFQLAREQGLDLVEISANSSPPVAKIMDYGKYKYMQKKNQKKNCQNKPSIKDIKMRVNIDDHDLVFKKKKLIELLGDGHTVRVTILFHGRELSHKELGENVIYKVLEGTESYGKITNPPKFEGQNLTATIVA